MNRFGKLSQAIWQYQVVWTPKYRYSVLAGELAEYLGKVKGRPAIRIVNKYRKRKQKPYWG